MCFCQLITNPPIILCAEESYDLVAILYNFRINSEHIVLTAILSVYISGHMDLSEATIMFDALSQETRLGAFRLLVKAGSRGVAAGSLSEELGTPHNTMSFHLNHLSNAGIVTSKRDGRSIIYSANFEVVRDLIGFMIKDCCSSEVANIREDEKKGCSIIELVNCCI